MHPKNGITKVYYVKMEGKLLGDEIHTLERGIVVDNKTLKPDKINLESMTLVLMLLMLLLFYTKAIIMK